MDAIHRALLPAAALACLALAACDGDAATEDAAAGAPDAPHGAIAGRVEGADGPVRVLLLRAADRDPDEFYFPAGRSRVVGPATERVTAADGAFRFDGLTRGEYVLRLTTELGDEVEDRCSLPGEVVRADRRLVARRPGGSAVVEGRVVLDGVPAAAARVQWEPLHWQTSPDRPIVRTAADGRFAIRGLASAEGALSIEVDDRCSASGLWAVPGGGDVDPLAGTDPIAVRVVDRLTGRPIEGAHVRVANSGGETRGAVHMRGTTGPAGEVALRARRTGLQVLVRAPGYLEASLRFAERRADVTVAVDRACAVTVRVVDDATGAAAAGARVAIASAWGEELQTALADESGTARVTRLPPGPVRARVVGGGFVTPAPHVPPPAGGYDDGVLLSAEEAAAGTATVRAVRAISLRGRVIGPEGAPVAGAAVVVSDGRRMHAGPPRPSDWGKTLTDADGSFVVPDLSPRTATSVWADPGDGRRGASQSLELGAGETAGLVLRIPSPSSFATIHAVVRDTDGAARARAWVVAHVKVDGRPAGGDSGPTDVSGRVRLGLVPAGECSVSTDGLPAETFTIGAGEVRTVTLTVPRTVSYAFRAADADGRTPEWGTAVLESVGGAGRATAGLGLDGAFTLDRLAPGAWTVKVTARRGRTRLSGAATIDTSAPGVTVALVADGEDVSERRIRVVDPDGRDVPAASWALHAERAGRCGDVAADGFMLPWLRVEEAASARLEVWGAASACGVPLPLGAVIVPIPDDGVVRLPAERRARGRVVDGRGGPVPGAVVVASPRVPEVPNPAPSPARHRASPSGHASAVTGADGSFDLGGLGAMPTVVRALPSRAIAAESPERAVGAEPVEIVVAVR